MTPLCEKIESKEIIRHQGEIFHNSNIMDEIIKKKLAIEVGNGLYVFKGVLAQIINKIDSYIFEISQAVGAEEIHIPYLLSHKNTIKSQYLNSFSNQAMMVEPYTETPSYDFHKLNKGIASPTICYHFFSSCDKETIDQNQVVTALGKCTRVEEIKQNDFSRLTNFTMREVIFLGREQFCQEKFNKILELTINLLSHKLDLCYKIVTASDPFFGNNSDLKKKAQLSFETKYEIQAEIPHNNEKLAVSSFNKHRDIFFNRFDMKKSTSEKIYSGCVGWGYERLMYAILCQKGPNFESSYYKKLLL